MTGELLPGGAEASYNMPDFSLLETLRQAIMPLTQPDFVPPTTVAESYAQRLEADLDYTERYIGRATDLPSVEHTHAGCMLGTYAQPTPYSVATRAIAGQWHRKKIA